MGLGVLGSGFRGFKVLGSRLKGFGFRALYGLNPQNYQNMISFGFYYIKHGGTIRKETTDNPKYLIIIYLRKTCTIITVTQSPSTLLLGTWTLRITQDFGNTEPGVWEPVVVI